MSSTGGFTWGLSSSQNKQERPHPHVIHRWVYVGVKFIPKQARMASSIGGWVRWGLSSSPKKSQKRPSSTTGGALVGADSLYPIKSDMFGIKNTHHFLTPYLVDSKG
jgi:hypothetical protein